MRIVTKLFSMYPVSRGQSLELAMAGYLEHTQDIPSYWLSVGIAKLIRDPELTFAPAVGKIRESVAREYRRNRGRTEWNARVGDAVNVERLLAQARESVGMPAPVESDRVPASVSSLVSQVEKKI